MDRLNQKRRIYLTHTSLSGRLVLRFCVGQTHTEAVHDRWRLGPHPGDRPDPRLSPARAWVYSKPAQTLGFRPVGKGKKTGGNLLSRSL